MPPDSVVVPADHLVALFAPGLDPVSFRTRAGVLLREVIGCQVASFASLDPATRQLDIYFEPFYPALQDALNGFGQHMAKYPCFNFDPTVNDGRPFLRADFVSDTEFYASAIYREGFKRADISDHAAILLPSTDHRNHFIGLELCGGGTYRAAHRDLMTILQPHLANARQLANSLAALDSAPIDPRLFVRFGFTPREAEVLAVLAAGKSNAEIAIVLGLQLSTVKGHVGVIFDKLGLDNRHAAILRAHQLLRQPPQPPQPRPATPLARTTAAHPHESSG
jgi:DNA-binding CsgD family transcriptional regulator